MKSRVNGLKATCLLKQSECERSQEAIGNFSNKIREMSRWIDDRGFGFVKDVNSFGHDYESALKFRDSNLDLSNQVYKAVCDKIDNYF